MPKEQPFSLKGGCMVGLSQNGSMDYSGELPKTVNDEIAHYKELKQNFTKIVSENIIYINKFHDIVSSFQFH